MERGLLFLLALLTWGGAGFLFTLVGAAAEGAIHEIEALLIGGFGFLTGSVFLTGACLAPPPPKKEPAWGD
jgi:hypothetical protein